MNEQSSILTLAALLLAVVSLIVAIAALVRQRGVLKPFEQIKDMASSPEEIVPAVLRQVEEMQENLNAIASALNKQINESRSFIQRVAIVRFDAFEDIGGQQSYSLCLLDGDKNGLLITYLTGRNSTRSYAVQVTAGQAARKLSEEERRALEKALSGDVVSSPV